MFTNSVYALAAPLYAIGKTPALDLTRHLPQYVESHILLLGCGDARHILYTCFVNRSFGPRKLDITCCDIEETIVARNVLFLSVLLEENETPIPESLWNIYYHLYLDGGSMNTLKHQVTRLLSASGSFEQWKQSKYGKTLRFCDSASFHAVRSVWARFGEAIAAQDSRDYRDRFKLAIKKSRDFRDLVGGGNNIDYSAVRATAPLAAQVVMGEEMEGIINEYWEKGTLGKTPTDTSIPNPMFACAPPESLIVTKGSEPITSYHLAAAVASLAEASPGRVDEQDGDDSVSEIVRSAQLQFREWASAFRDSKSHIVVRFAATDCFALCQTFQYSIETGYTTAHWYRRPLSFDPLELDSSEYGEGGKAPKQFDAIDTSNLADHLGTLSLLISAGPLLKDLAWATLSVELMERDIESEQRKFDTLLCGHTKPLSVLLGLSPVEYWTNATTVSTVDEFLLAKSINSMSGQKKEFGIQTRISWKASRHLSMAPGTDKLTIEADVLGNLLFRVYQNMFQSESASYLAKIMRPDTISDIRKDVAYSKYHRGTFVALVKAVAKNVSTDRQVLCQRIIKNISTDKDNIFASNTSQALCLELSKQGLYTEEWLTRGIRRNASAGGFSSWRDIPEAVSLTFVVPPSKWKVVSNIASHENIALTLQASIRAVANDKPLWHNMYADVQICFGTVIAAGSRHDDNFAVTVDENKLAWAGNSPMIISFNISAAALQADISKTQVSLALQHSVQNTNLFMKTLGGNLTIFETPLQDEKHVFVTKQSPRLSGYRVVGGSLPVDHLSTVSASKQPTFKVELSGTGSISSVTGHVDIISEQGKALLAEKVPIELRQGLHSHVTDIVFGNNGKPDLVLSLHFPVPVRQNQSKTRIARTSCYVEVIAPLAEPIDPILHGLILPSALVKTIPATLNITHLNLDILPILDLNDKMGSRFLITLTSFMYSARERKLRDEVDESGVSADNPRLNFKESLFTMFMLASGLQGGQTGLFALSRSDSDGIHMLVFVSAIRLDGPNGSVVLDAAILPFTKKLIESRAIEDFLLILRTLECCSLNIDDAELLLWKKTLPALVERCRTWEHTADCEYKRAGATIPLALESGAQLLCSCGKGKLPEDFIGLPEWDAAAQECTRIAISPVYASQFVEESINPEKLVKAAGFAASDTDSFPDMCRNCGATEAQNGRDLKKCARCLAVKYCSAECQKKDWKKHRMECEESSGQDRK